MCTYILIGGNKLGELTELIDCKCCGFIHIVKCGFWMTVSRGKTQRYQCMNCGKSFYNENEVGALQ